MLVYSPFLITDWLCVCSYLKASWLFFVLHARCTWGETRGLYVTWSTVKFCVYPLSCFKRDVCEGVRSTDVLQATQAGGGQKGEGHGV